jgi:peptidoglycan-associated lipoprotein
MVTRRIGRTWGVILALGIAPLLLAGCPKRPDVAGGAGIDTPGARSPAGQKSPVVRAPAPTSAARSATVGIGAFREIYFAVDRYDIEPRHRPTLDKVAEWLGANAGARLVIEGHCDESGSVEYNLALGERRAQATRDYLVARGIDAGRISIVSCGKQQPVCSVSTDECRARNRRAHLLTAR